MSGTPRRPAHPSSMIWPGPLASPAGRITLRDGSPAADADLVGEAVHPSIRNCAWLVPGPKRRTELLVRAAIVADGRKSVFAHPAARSEHLHADASYGPESPIICARSAAGCPRRASLHATMRFMHQQATARVIFTGRCNSHAAKAAALVRHVLLGCRNVSPPLLTSSTVTWEFGMPGSRRSSHGRPTRPGRPRYLQVQVAVVVDVGQWRASTPVRGTPARCAASGTARAPRACCLASAARRRHALHDVDGTLTREAPRHAPGCQSGNGIGERRERCVHDVHELRRTARDLAVLQTTTRRSPR